MTSGVRRVGESATKLVKKNDFLLRWIQFRCDTRLRPRRGQHTTLHAVCS